MKKRDTVLALLALGITPFAAKAQPARKMPRIGVLWHAGSEQEEAIYLAALRRGFRDLGYVEGQNIVLENRYPDEQLERFDSYAAELVRLKVDVLVAVTGNAAFAAQRATSSIPIVMLYGPDPVRTKLVESLARPGGNITGLPHEGINLNPKRVELLKEAVPALTRVAVLLNPDNVTSKYNFEVTQAAAQTLKITALPIEVRRADELENAFSRIANDRANGVFVLGDGMYYVQRARIADLALKRRLPTMMPWMEAVESGGFMSYAPSYRQIAYRAAYYVDRILKGTPPRDLPVELPTKFEMVFNSKTAKALGLIIPPTVLQRADEVIQ